MTEQHTDVDLDLLADYIGGALDGTPDADRVGRLVAGDPAWQAAFGQLATAMTAAGAELRALPDAGPLPDDVAERIAAALAGLPALSDDELARLDALAPEPLISHAPAPALEQPARHPHAVPGGAGRPPAGPGRTRARRRLRRFAAPVAVAAGVLAFAGLGVNLLGGGTSTEDTASTSGAGQPQVFNAPDATSADRSSGGAESAGGSPAATARILASGADYTAESLKARIAVKGPETRASVNAAAPADAPVLPAQSVAPDLARLLDPAALQACLEAIAREHGAGPVGADTIDFARFQGVPALVVHLTAPDGSYVWVSGPGCGTPGIGADTRYQGQVG